MEPTPSPVAPEPSRQQTAFVRPILPEARIVLAGEIATRQWAITLTDAQAASPARLRVAYQNAVVVAPENSVLELRINGTLVVSEPIAAADETKRVEVEVPAGVLRPGRNELSLRARQRHRTDCSVSSTFELWTELRSTGTALVFADPAAGRFATLAQVPAIPPSPDGSLRIEVLAPSAFGAGWEDDLLRLAQVLALQAGLPQVEMDIRGDARPSEGEVPPSLRVLYGKAEEFAPTFDLPTASNLSDFTPSPDNVPTLALLGSGPEQAAAINRMAVSVDRAAGTMRETLTTEAWRAPNPPMLYEGRSLAFSELGLRSEQFAGRRYSTGFAIGIPSDFYANAYGQARILLDAAYADVVLPGSQINVYVNGTIAASVPITSTGGAILNRFPIKISMQNLRPGRNDIDVEVNMVTEQDLACLPGATANATPRFAIFETSSFVMPPFARIAEYPNLAALSGTAFPYSLAAEPLPIVLERNDASSLSAAAELLARMALSAGRVMPVELGRSVDAIRGRNAIFLSVADGVPAGVLSQVGLDANVTRWRDPQNTPAGQVDVQRWRDEMNARGVRGRLETFQNWLGETFNISLDMLRFLPGEDVIYAPTPDVGLVVAQGINPERTGVWTVVTATTPETLLNGVTRISGERDWRSVSGHLSAWSSDLTRLTVMPVTTSEFRQTQPLTLRNARLIAANWLSTNILSYAVALVVVCVLLGIATTALLSLFGRRE